MAVKTHTVEVGYDEFCGALAAKDLQPLWTQSGKLMPKQPRPTTVPWLWKWDTIFALAERAGELITVKRGGDRRVLALANPGLDGQPYTSSTLWGAIQYLGPRESAPAHRHTPSAIRFVMQGEGVWTTVNGDSCEMRPGDLVLTPNWAWHDHHNEGDSPMVWFDGLDLPFVGMMEAVFFENHPDLRQPITDHNGSERRYGGRALRTRSIGGPLPHAPLLRYPWAETDRALAETLAAEGGPMVSLEYTNPLDGRPAIPTFSSEMHRLAPGCHTRPHRKVGSSVFVVHHGNGTTIVNGQRFDWSPGDIFVTPSWSIVEHQSAEQADLFSISDRPILQALHLYREAELEEPQEVIATFEPK